MSTLSRSLLKRVPVATVVRVGMEVCLVTALVWVVSTVFGQGGWSSIARRMACAPPVVNGKPACCGPGCRGDLGKAASHYDEKYFQWQVRTSFVFSVCGGAGVRSANVGSAPPQTLRAQAGPAGIEDCG